MQNLSDNNFFETSRNQSLQGHDKSPQTLGVIFLGLPGSGKGTQSRYLEKKYGFKVLGMGDLLREEVKRGTELGKRIKPIIESGGRPENDLVIDLLARHFDFIARDTKKGFILDGFPRDTDQARGLQTLLAKYNLAVTHAIYLVANYDACSYRIVHRMVCRECGTNYSDTQLEHQLSFKCINCKAQGIDAFYKRTDDRPEVFQTRVETQEKYDQELINFYRAQDVLHQIDGMQPVEAVTESIEKLIQEWL